MATRHASALKAHRQSEKRRLVNRKSRGHVKTALKAERELLAKGQAAEAQKSAPATIAAIDRAVAKGVLHRNAAARRKSRLQKRLNVLLAKKS